MGKKFIELKEGDIIYAISLHESEMIESFGSGLRKLEIDSIIRTTDMFRIQVRTKGGTSFTVNPNVNTHIVRKDENDEVNLTFDVYATSKDNAIEEAQREIASRLRTLALIKRRVGESETGLLLADAALDAISQEEDEPTLEEFASMALG